MLCNHKHCFETILITLSLPTSSCFSRKSHAETWSKGFVCLVFSRLTYVEPKHQSNEHNQAGADDFQGLMRISSVQLLSRVQLFVDPNSWSLLKLMSIESMMPSNHLILCRPLLLPLPIFPSIRVFSSESVFLIRWPKYWSLLFLLWLPLFILSGVISPLISSSILGTYQPGEFILQYPILLPFRTVHGVLKARILKWFASPFSNGPHSVRSLHHDPPSSGCPTGISFIE